MSVNSVIDIYIYPKYMSIDGALQPAHHGPRFKINLNYINYVSIPLQI